MLMAVWATHVDPLGVDVYLPLQFEQQRKIKLQIGMQRWCHTAWLEVA